MLMGGREVAVRRGGEGVEKEGEGSNSGGKKTGSDQLSDRGTTIEGEGAKKSPR